MKLIENKSRLNHSRPLTSLNVDATLQVTVWDADLRRYQKYYMLNKPQGVISLTDKNIRRLSTSSQGECRRPLRSDDSTGIPRTATRDGIMVAGLRS